MIDNGTEYVYFVDPSTSIRYGFNVTFMLSHYGCNYGCGCPGVAGDKVIACCTHGVDLEHDDDFVRTLHWAERAVDLNVWQNAEVFIDDPESYIYKYEYDDGDEEGDYAGVGSYNHACIFLNRDKKWDGSRKGENGLGGCALHHASRVLGEPFQDGKPRPCWQFPLWLEENEDDYKTIGPVPRADSVGITNGTGWWCIDNEGNYDPNNPFVYQSFEKELIRMSSNDVYDLLKQYCDARVDLGGSLPYNYGAPMNRRRDGHYPTTPVTLTRKQQPIDPDKLPIGDGTANVKSGKAKK